MTGDINIQRLHMKYAKRKIPNSILTRSYSTSKSLHFEFFKHFISDAKIIKRFFMHKFFHNTYRVL